MLATVTVKGQVTVPKPIRDQLNISQGTKLDFTVNADGSMSIRALERSARSIVGLLKKAGTAPKSIEAMNDAVAEGAIERHRRVRAAK